jgi:hypothetical protein
MAHDVFISHSSKDKQIADAMCNKLESSGIRCWMAPRDIWPGRKWSEAIVQAIEESSLLLLIFSTNSNSSDHIEREIEIAANKRKPILPFRVEDVRPSGALEFFLGTPHWLDALTPPLEQHLNQLVVSVKRLLPPPPREMTTSQKMTPAATAPETPTRATDVDELVGVDEQADASQRADRAREKEEVRRRAEQEARRRADEMERKRQQAKELRRKQQAAEAETARKSQDALLKQKDEGPAPKGTVATQLKEPAQKSLNRIWGWGLFTILIGSFVITLVANSIKFVAIGLFVLCPIFSVYVILKERKSKSHENRKN